MHTRSYSQFIKVYDCVYYVQIKFRSQQSYKCVILILKDLIIINLNGNNVNKYINDTSIRLCPCADNDPTTHSDYNLTLIRKQLQGFGHLQMNATPVMAIEGVPASEYVNRCD